MLPENSSLPRVMSNINRKKIAGPNEKTNRFHWIGRDIPVNPNLADFSLKKGMSPLIDIAVITRFQILIRDLSVLLTTIQDLILLFSKESYNLKVL